MGLEDNIKLILEETQALESSINNISMLIVNLEDKLHSSLQSAAQDMKDSAQPIEAETLATISRLPEVLKNLIDTYSDFSNRFDNLNHEVSEGLKFIKVSYVEDIVVTIRNLSKEIIDKVNSSAESSKNLYELSVQNYLPISDRLERIENSLNALIENQTDQLSTVAELRDRVNAIIQVELAALKDRITIYLESSVNELKTSVAERLGNQEEILGRLSGTTQQLSQAIASLPKTLSQEIDTSVETKILSSLEDMKKEIKKMTAFIIRGQRISDSEG